LRQQGDVGVGDDGILWLGMMLLVTVPIGLALSRYWARSRASGVVRLDGTKADPKAQIEPTLERDDRLPLETDQR
jgi:hypothetical protein